VIVRLSAAPALGVVVEAVIEKLLIVAGFIVKAPLEPECPDSVAVMFEEAAL
jgi:hypothetical protein